MNTELTTTYSNATRAGFQIAQNSRLNVTNNSTLTINTTVSAISDVGNWPAIITVDEGSTLMLNKASTFGKDVSLNVAGTIDGTGAITLQSGSTLTAATLNRRNASFTVASGASATVDTALIGGGRYFNIYGTMEIKSATTFYQLNVMGSLTQSAGDTTTLCRSATFGTNSEFSTTGAITINGGSTDPTSASFATITIAADSKSFNVNASDARVIFKNGALVLNRENAIVKSDGTFVRIVTTDSSTINNLTIGASQTFREIYANVGNLNLYLANPEAVVITALSVDSTGDLIIHDFVDECVKVTNYNLIADPNTLVTAYKTVEGNEVKIDKLYFTADGFLTSIAVPEPAEWAAIFGALALALAVYRRRK